MGFLYSDGWRREGTVLGLPWPAGHRWQHWRRVRLDGGGGVFLVDSKHVAFEQGTNLPATAAPDTAQATAARGGRKRRGLSSGTDPPAETDVQSRSVKRARAAVAVAVAAESKTRRERVLARPAKRPAKTNAAGAAAAAAAKAGAAKSKAKANAKAQAVKKKPAKAGLTTQDTKVTRRRGKQAAPKVAPRAPAPACWLEVE